MARRRSVAAAACLLLLGMALGPLGAAAHGYLAVPPARNWVAAQKEGFSDAQSGNGLGLGSPPGNPNVAGDPFQGYADTTKFLNRPFAAQAAYAAGATIGLTVQLTANHGGRFLFRICPRTAPVDEACLGTNYLTRADNGQFAYYIMNGTMTHTMNYKLPPGISCPGGCVLQWKY